MVAQFIDSAFTKFNNLCMRKTIALISILALTFAVSAFPVVPASLDVPPELYTETAVAIEGNGRTVPGTLCLPVSDTPVPAVVMLHGTGSSRDEAGNGYLLTAPVLAKAGIASLRIDFPGSGDSEAGYELYCYTAAKEDAIAAKRYLEAIPETDGERVGIMGWSQGGSDAIYIAAVTDEFKSVVLWAGALDLSGVGDEAMYEEARANGYAMLEYDWRDSQKLGLVWFEETYSTDLLSLVEDITAPLLAINGEVDDTVDPASGRLIAETAPNALSDYTVIPGADHTFNIFSEPLAETLALTAGTTASWFKETL